MRNYLRYPLNIQLFAEDGSGGEGGDTGAQAGAQVTATQQIDYDKLAEVVSKRSAGTEDKVLQGYFKQQGLTPEQASEAMNQYKQAQATKQQEEAQRIQTMQQENAQLKNYLGLKENNPDYQFVSASVINRDPNNLYYTFTLDQGSNAGVKVNDPVITDQGVVGWVSQVSAMYCEVTTILSPDTNISATDKVNRESGTISSNAQLSDQGLIKLGLLEAGTTVQEGDIIVTSGIGGKFPKDLLIGNAVEVKPEENDVSLYATVEPFVDIKTVRDVIIITSFNGQGEVADNTDTNNASSNGG